MKFLRKISKFQINQAWKGNFIKKDEWPPNSPVLNSLDFYIPGGYAWEISSLHTEADK